MELAIVVARRFWLEISLRKTGKDRKRAYKKKRKRTYKKDERWHPNSRAQPPRSGDCDRSWTSSFERGNEVDYQVAAPTETSTPTMHRATIAQQRVRMEGWRQERLGSRAGTHREEEKNKKNILTRKKREETEKTHLTHTGLLMEGP
jgi:hypothetical protein